MTTPVTTPSLGPSAPAASLPARVRIVLEMIKIEHTLFALPFAWNTASCRVLEKNGFERMAVKQCHIPEEPWAGPTALYRLQRP